MSAPHDGHAHDGHAHDGHEHGGDARPGGRTQPAAQVTRRDDGLAQRALRVGVSPQALIVHLGTDVVVRTPGRPDHHAGNVVDVLAPPRPSDVTSLVERVERTMTPLGVQHVHLRFELHVDERPDAELADALAAAGLDVAMFRVLELPASAGDAHPPSELPAGLTIERLGVPAADATGQILERRWHAAAVLDRYAAGEDVPAWRTWDEEGARWARATVRELAALGRAEVWLAMRQGMPVATLTVVRDLDGIAVIEDLVTHPAHRLRGVARALLATVIDDHRRRRPAERLLAAVTPGSVSERLHVRSGMTPVADVCSALRPPGRTVGESPGPQR